MKALFLSNMFSFSLTLFFLTFTSSIRFKPGNESIINEQTSQNQRYPKIASLNNGESFVVVWESISAGFYEVRGKIFSANGSVLVPEFKINQDTSVDARLPIVSALYPQDSFAVAYFVTEVIIGRIFWANGTGKTNAKTLTGIVAPTFSFIGLSFNENGGFVVGWRNTSDVYFSYFNHEGEKIADDYFLSSPAQCEGIFMTSIPDGTIIAVTHDDGIDSVVGFFLSGFDPLNGFFSISSPYYLKGYSIMSSFMSNQNLLIVWTCRNPDSDVCYAVVGSDGANIYPGTVISIDSSGLEYNPSVTPIMDRESCLITWISEEDNKKIIKASIIDQEGRKLKEEYALIESDSNKTSPVAVSLSQGKILTVVWESHDNDQLGIFFKSFQALLCDVSYYYYYYVYDLCLENCLSDTMVEVYQSYCDVNCSRSGTFFISSSSQCNETCDANGYGLTQSKECAPFCDEDLYYLHVNQTCIASCPIGYEILFELDVAFCSLICPSGFFHPQQSMCRSVCPNKTSYTNAIIDGAKLCYFACADGHFYNTATNSCLSLCNETGFSPLIELSSNRYCEFACSNLSYYYYEINNTCSSDCFGSGFTPTQIDVFRYCKFSCPRNSYYISSNNSCTRYCSYPYVNENSTGYFYCRLPCNQSEYLDLDGHCRQSCESNLIYTLSGVLMCNKSYNLPINNTNSSNSCCGSNTNSTNSTNNTNYTNNTSNTNNTNNTNNAKNNISNNNSNNSNLTSSNGSNYTNNTNSTNENQGSLLDFAKINETTILSKSDSLLLANHMNSLLLNVSDPSRNLTLLQEKILLYMNVLTNSASNYLTLADNSTTISTTTFDAYFKKMLLCEVNNTLLNISETDPEFLIKAKNNSTANCSSVVMISLFVFNTSLTNPSAQNSSKSIIALSIKEQSTKKELLDQFTATIFMKNNETCSSICKSVGTNTCECDSLLQFSFEEQISQMFSNIKITQLNFSMFLHWRFYEDPSFYCMLFMIVWYLATIILIKYKVNSNSDLIVYSKVKTKTFKILKSLLIMHPILEIYFIYDKNKSRSLRATLYFLRFLLALSMASIFSAKSSFPSLRFELRLDLSEINFLQFLFPYFTYIPIIIIISYIVSSPKIQSSKTRRIVAYSVMTLLIPMLILTIFVIASNQSTSEKVGWIQGFFFTMVQDLLLGPVIGVGYQFVAAYFLKKTLESGIKIKGSCYRKILEKIVDDKVYAVLYEKKKMERIFKRTRQILKH